MALDLGDRKSGDTPRERKSTAQLSPVETGVIDLFVQLSHLLGQPRSLAEINGRRFIPIVARVLGA